MTSAMAPGTLYGLVPSLITLQFAAFGWRMNREINLPHRDRAKWMPIPDVLNILSLLAALIFLIVLPIVTAEYFWLSRMVLGSGYVLIAFHPFTVSAHHCLWSKNGRSKYLTEGKAYPYATREELVLASLSIVLAVIAGVYIATH